MKFLCTSDNHLRGSTPKNRIDDFEKALYDKVHWYYSLALKEGCRYILRGGDLTNSATIPYSVTQKYIDLFLKFKEKGVESIDIAGQHDMRYHSKDLVNTPIMTFAAAKATTLLTSGDMIEVEEGIHIYGAGWNDDVPKIEDKDAFNVLLIHSMIISEKIWYGQEDYESANRFLKESDFDLIVSGDNHKTVLARTGDPKHHLLELCKEPERWLLNTGSLMRQNSDQVEHKPIVFVFDTELRKPFPFYVPCKDISEVMNLEKITKEKTQNKELNSFVEGLNENPEETGLDFLLNCRLGLPTSGLSERGIHYVEGAFPK